jgi:3-oxoacyl-(acyl-carrier-protein) synthase
LSHSGSWVGDCGVVVGSALGNLGEAAQFLDRLFTKGPGLVNPMLFPNLVMNAAASQVAMALAWRGPNLTVSCGEISGEAALETGIELVRRGRARAVVVAAGEELSEVLFRALKELRVLSPRGRGLEGSRPFDVNANGPVLGEGASALVVETLESAVRRGARIHAVVERVERFQLSVRNPHVWPALDALRAASVPLPSASADVALCGADSSPERDGVETGLLRRLAPTAPPVYSLAGAVGSWLNAHTEPATEGAPEARPTQLTGTLVYAVPDGAHRSRLWRWDLATGRVVRGPRVPRNGRDVPPSSRACRT